MAQLRVFHVEQARLRVSAAATFCVLGVDHPPTIGARSPYNGDCLSLYFDNLDQVLVFAEHIINACSDALNQETEEVRVDLLEDTR